MRPWNGHDRRRVSLLRLSGKNKTVAADAYERAGSLSPADRILFNAGRAAAGLFGATRLTGRTPGRRGGFAACRQKLSYEVELFESRKNK